MRLHSIQVLGSVAAALEAAARQKQTLLAEVRTAQQTLDALANERELAEATLAALAADIAALQRQRAAHTAASDALPASALGIRQPTVVRAIRTYLERSVHPIDPGFGNVATALFIALFIAMALLLSPLTQVFGGLQLLAVTSGSMAPAIPTGSMVGVHPVAASALKIGDVITFANSTSPDVLITHRIVSVDVSDGQTMLTTRGDANDTVDALSAPASRAVGRVDFAVPWLGDVMIWLGSPMAKAASVCLALLALALSVASARRSTWHSLAVH